MKQLVIRLPKDIEERLRRLARATGRTKAFHARAAITQCLEHLEDRFLAEQEYAKVLAGKSRTVPLQELVRRFSARKGLRRG